MSNTSIQLKKSGATGNTPTGLAFGEVAINYADGKLYYKNALGGTSYISNQFSFDTINANNSLILATGVSDTLSFVAGNNISISTNTTTKTITINSTASGATDQFARDVANSGYAQANTATNNAAGASLYANGAFAQANAAFNKANTYPGNPNQVLYKNSSNVLTSSSGLVYDGVSIKVNGNLESTFQSGDEGGEIFLNKSVTNTTLTTGVSIDVYQNRLRIFETGGTNRGVYIDMANGAAGGIGTNLLSPAGGAVTSVAGATGTVSNTQLIAGIQTVSSSYGITFDYVATANNGQGTNFKVGDDAWIGDYNIADSLKIKGQQNAANGYVSFGSNTSQLGAAGSGQLTYGGNIVWHAGNDGAGSGLDADLLDGLNGSDFARVSAESYANSAFSAANTADSKAVTAGSYANSAYTQANTATTNAATADSKAVTAGSYANSAYTQANTATTNAATADSKAVTAGSYANSAFAVANTDVTNVSITAGTYGGTTAIPVVTVAANGRVTAVTNAAITATGSFINNGTSNVFFSGANGSIIANVAGNTIFSITANGITTVGASGDISGANNIYANTFIANAAISISGSGGNISGANNIFANVINVTTSSIVAGVNVVPFIQSAFTQANTGVNNAAGASLYANGAFVQANAGYTQANTATNNAAGASLYANGAFIQANAAYNSQNTTGTYANSAYTQANTATTNAATADSKAVTAGSYANSAFNRANNALPTSGGTISGSLTVTQDVSITGNLIVLGNTTSINTNSFTVEDTLLTLGLGNYTSDLLDIGFSSHYNDGTNAHTGLIRDASEKQWMFFEGYTPEVSPNNNIVITDPSFRYANVRARTFTGNLIANTVVVNGTNLFTYTDNAYNQANTATNNAAGASLYANGAFIQANAAFLRANTPDAIANSAALYANAAFIQANAAFAAANSGGGGAGTDNVARQTANAAFIQANSAFNLANNLSVTSNNLGYFDRSYNGDNTTTSFAVTSGVTNNSIIVTENGIVQAPNADYYVSGTNVIFRVAPTSTVVVGIRELASTGNVVSNYEFANAAFIQANAAFLRANTPDAIANSAALYANGAFTQANAAYTQANTATNNAATADSKAVTAGSYANSSFGVANSAALYANGAFIQANAAFLRANTPDAIANSAALYANGAFLAANTADGKAVTSGSYANSAFIQANAAFDVANAASAAANNVLGANVFSFIGTGACTTFTLGVTSSLSSNSIIAGIDGILQLHSAYTVSSNVITFSEAPANNANIEIQVIGGLEIVPLTLTPEVATTSGTTVVVTTSIPPSAKRVTVNFYGISLSGTNLPLIQFGTGATPTWTTSGYASSSDNYATTAGPAVFNSTGFVLGSTSSAGSTFIGSYTFTLVGGNKWVGNMNGTIGGGSVLFGGGGVSLGSPLTSIRLNSTGTNTYDAGSVSVLYE